MHSPAVVRGFAWMMLLALAIAVATILSTVVYYLYGENPPIVYLNNPFPLNDEDGILHPGDTISLKVKRNNPYDFSRSFVVTRQIKCNDGQKFGLESRLHPVEAGITETDLDSAKIPMTIHIPTTCHVVGNTQIAGRIVTHFVHWRSKDFLVQ